MVVVAPVVVVAVVVMAGNDSGIITECAELLAVLKVPFFHLGYLWPCC